MASFDMALDLGSQFISVLTKNNDILIKQHNLVAVKNDESHELLACGNGALKIFQHNPQKVKLIKPVDECNILNKEMADCFFNWLFTIVNKEAFDNQKARILCVVGCGINANEKKAIETMFVNLGAKLVNFVESPKAAEKMIFQEFKVRNGIILNLGDSMADFGCMIDGQLKNGCSLYLAGKHVDIGIKKFVEEHYNIHIELEQAEQIKKQCSMFENNIAQILVSGTNFENKCLEKVEIPVRALFDVIAFYINKYIDVIKSMLKSVEPDIAEKLKLGGVYLCGGGSQMEGLKEYMSKKLEIGVKISAYTTNAAVYGARLLIAEKYFG